jgi:hypothetical protein
METVYVPRGLKNKVLKFLSGTFLEFFSLLKIKDDQPVRRMGRICLSVNLTE